MRPLRPEAQSTGVFVVAEAGVNHDGNVERACALIDAAAAAGADAVKFQSFRTNTLVTATAPKAPYQARAGGAAEGQGAMLQRLELGPAEHQVLVEHCGAVGIEFMSSPFDLESLRFLVEECGVRRIKLGSGELTHGQLLLSAARCGLPLLVSTGMATLAEVQEALALLAFGMLEPSAGPTALGCREAWEHPAGREILQRRVILLHCTSAYPTRGCDVHLRAMDRLAEAFGLPVGYSDHSLGCMVPWAAVSRGAPVLEKHLTLDRLAQGPDHAASSDPEEFRRLVAGVREIEQALGTGDKQPCAAELPQRQVARRSLVAARSLPAGTVLAEGDVIAKRPAGGLSPMLYWQVLGRQLTCDLACDAPITEDALSGQRQRAG